MSRSAPACAPAIPSDGGVAGRQNCRNLDLCAKKSKFRLIVEEPAAGTIAIRLRKAIIATEENGRKPKGHNYFAAFP
jgi:hypothetical protein